MNSPFGFRPVRRGVEPHERGQGLVEYALIVVLVAVVVIVILVALGPSVRNVFARANCALRDASHAQICIAAPVGGFTNAVTALNNYCATHQGQPYFQYYVAPSNNFKLENSAVANVVGKFGAGSYLVTSGTCPS